MINYSYTKENWPTYDAGNSMEWIITNGIGSYGGASLIGGLNRTSQGLFVCSLNSPEDRYVVLEQMVEWVKCGETVYDLETSKTLIGGKEVYKNGQDFLTDVVYDGTVTYHYECGHTVARPATPMDDSSAVSMLSATSDTAVNNDIREEMPEFELTKYIALKREDNTLAIGYDFVNNSDHEADVVLTPWFNFRPDSELTFENLPKFDMLRTGDTLSLVPRINPYVRIDLSISGGVYHDAPEKILVGSILDTEKAEGKDYLNSHYTPVDISTTLPPHSRCSYSVLVSVVISDVIQGMALLQNASDCFLNNRSAHKLVRLSRQYYMQIVDKAGFNDELADKLVLAADSLLSLRKSTETETILAGLPCYVDRSLDTLKAFTGLTLATKRYEEAGQILFTLAKFVKGGLIPDELPNEKNEAMCLNPETSLWFFVDVYKYLKYLRADSNIGDEYMRNALSFIYKNIFPILAEIIDTFEYGHNPLAHMMENGLIRVGDDTPDEINALWYNALNIMEYLCKVFRADGNHYLQLAEKAKKSHSLNEKVSLDQAYLLSLPYQILTIKAERELTSVLETALNNVYRNGNLETKYYGPFFTGYRKVNGSTKDGRAKVKELYDPILRHLAECGCIGGISEIIGSDNRTCGAANFAAAVGDIFRAYAEDVLNILDKQ